MSIGDAPCKTRRLRNRDLELCSSAKWNITLGCPSIDRYYLESSDSFVLHAALPALLRLYPIFPYILFSLTSFLANSNLSIFSSLYVFSPISVSPFLLSGFCFHPFHLLPFLPTRLESLFFWISREKCCLMHYCPYSKCKSKNIAESNRRRA